MQTQARHIPPVSTAPDGFSIERDLPEGFAEFYRPLHARLAPGADAARVERYRIISASLAGTLPDYFAPSAASGDWQIELPAWAADQRNQMTGPADDRELIVKMLNSGSPGVMIDLEDSMANEFARTLSAIDNAVDAYNGTLTYVDTKRGDVEIAIKPSSAVLWTRVRGLHLSQAGVLPERTSASLFDLALLAYKLDFATLKHPLAIYIPKTETAAEGLWWRDAFAAVAAAKGVSAGTIKCMALVESHSFAYQIEEFALNLRDHLLGLNLGRWDYMASLIHHTLSDPAWILPDRNTIPFDVPFFQALRGRIPDVCHAHGMLAIGGMTALFPDRNDAELNARAMTALETDKRNEAAFFFDGAWTGHPDQNDVAVAQFPAPNQLASRKAGAAKEPDLRPPLAGVGTISRDGTRAAIRTVIRYRHGYLSGRGASLLDGYMEDLATDRIYRLMIAQRLKHGLHSAADIARMFDEELSALCAAHPDEAELYMQARQQSEAMIAGGFFDPI